MVAVPPDAPAHVEQHFVQHAEIGRKLVRNHLGGVEMARVETAHFPSRRRVKQIEFVGAHGTAFDADAEKFGLHGVPLVLFRETGLEAGVERSHQPLPRRHTVGGDVLEAVRGPEVDHRGAPQRLAEGRADLPAAQAVIDPELPDPPVGMGEGKVVVQLGVAVEGGGDVQPDLFRLGPVEPAGKVLDGEGVPVHAGEHPVHLVALEAHPVTAGKQGEGVVQVGHEFRGGAGAPGVVPRHLTAPRQSVAALLEAGDVVPLPGVDADLDGLQSRKGLFRVHAVRGVKFRCQLIKLAVLLHDSSPSFEVL